MDAFERYLEGEAKAAFEELLEKMHGRLVEGGQSLREAVSLAREMARDHMKHRFRKERPELNPDAPQALGEILKKIKRTE